MTKIRVRVGSAEAEVEADPEHIREAIGLVPELVSKLPGSRPEPLEPRRSQSLTDLSGTEHRPFGQIPIVSLDKGDSLADVIEKFFADPWGRERRKLSDVREALESYGLNYPKQSVAVALLRLAKASRLRRFKAGDGEFVYTSSAIFAPSIAMPGDSEAPDELSSAHPN